MGLKVPGDSRAAIQRVGDSRTVRKLANTICACNKSDVIDRLELLGGSRAALRQVGDRL